MTAEAPKHSVRDGKEGEPSTLARILRFFEPLDRMDLEPAFERTLGGTAESLAGVADAELCSIWVPHPPRQVLQLAHTTLKSVGPLPEALPMSGSRSGEAVSCGTVRYYASLDEGRPCYGADSLRTAGLTQMWCVPLLCPSLGLENHVAAVATLHFPEGSTAGNLDEAFLRFCGVRAGRVLERALWAEQDAVVQQAYRAMGDLEHGAWAAMDEVAATIAKLLHFAACTILLADSSVRSLRIIGTTGIPSDKPRREWVYEFGQAATGHVAATGATVASENVEHEAWGGGDSALADRIDGGRTRQFLGTPIRSTSSRLIGVIRLCNKQQLRGATWTRRLNYLDWLRIERVARVIGPLLSLVAERVHVDSALRRIRHDQKAPAAMIRDCASHYARLPREQLLQQLDELLQGLEDCGSLAELIMVNADLTRLDTEAGIELHPERDFLLAGFVAKLCKMFRPKCRSKELKGPYFDDFSAIPKLWIDPTLMQIALYNLLDNAVKYSHRGTEIQIRSEGRASGKTLAYAIHVSNWGIGVAPEERERIFERYYRGSQARGRDVTGLGLGLSVAAAIVARHGGVLRLTSLNNPTTFTIELPGVLATRRPPW